MRYVEHLEEIYESHWRGVIPASAISGSVNVPEKCAHVPGTRKGYHYISDQSEHEM